MTEALRPTLTELTATSFRVGCLGFGGPAGQIALMHRVFVEEKKWVSEERYLHALNYCMLLPGPEAQQLATYVGWLLHGVRGGVIAGALFVLPGALVVLALSWLYATQGDAPLVMALFDGVKAAVLAFVAEALWRIGKRALKTRGDLALALAVFLALALFGVPFPLLILAAALIGAFRPRAAAAREPEAPTQRPSTARAFATAGVWLAIWFAPLGAAFALLGPNHLLTQVGVLFSQLSMVTFGGAYAVLAYLQQQAVDTQHWLTAGQMIDGLGLAETTPGPLILVNQFVGFIAGWQAQGPWLALAAAAMASWCTFAPSFVWIFAGAPFAERLRQSRWAAGALAAITAAVLGVIANLAFWFSLHVLFARTLNVATPWGHVIALPVTSLDLYATTVAIACGVALIRFRVNAVLVVFAAALAGWLHSALPLP